MGITITFRPVEVRIGEHNRLFPNSDQKNRNATCRQNIMLIGRWQVLWINRISVISVTS